MKLRGIDFGNVLGASGVQGFFGEGYWFHKLWKLFGLNLSRMTFVSKTATLQTREGNMPLTKRYGPKHWLPSCVKVKFWRGLMLNSVGLSNPGLISLINELNWQQRKKPFLISIMSLADTPQGRFEEFKTMVDILKSYQGGFSAPFGLQINLSCPNTGHDPKELIGESEKVLEIASKLKVPLVPKYSIASASIEAVMELNSNPLCDAICVSNTLPFGFKDLDWEKVWGTNVSPLASIGGGGLSGKALCPLVCSWIKNLRCAGFIKPINGGGGILCKADVKSYFESGASSVFLGSVAALRPWRVRGIINYANQIEWR